jgi:flagellar protein FlaI
MAIETKIEEMVRFVQKKGNANFKEIAKALSWDEQYVEKFALILEKAKLAKTHYMLNVMEHPTVAIFPEPPMKAEEESAGKLMEEYEISPREGHVLGSVRIYHSVKDRRPAYHLMLPQLSSYTRAYLEYLKEEVSKRIPPASEEKSSESVEANFRIRYAAISKTIEKDLNPDPSIVETITDITINEMYGLGELEALIGDQKLEEIVINSASLPVAVYHRRYGWLKTNVRIPSEAEIENYSQQIARKVGRQISTLNPVLDAHLGTGDRVNATLFPISSHGNTITLRLFARNPWTIVTFTKPEVKAMSVEMAALLWQALQYEMNVLVAGGTASGKTSALNGLLALVQPFQRIVTIEDTRELMLPSYQWNWVPLVTRLPNPEGQGEVTMLDLLVNSLRMRPDRIVMGEIRRKREAEVLFEAMHTGHSVYSTIHADTGSQVLKRLIEPPIEVPESEVEDLHLIMVQYRDRRKNIRRTLELSEVITGASGPELNRVFSWRARDDTFQAVKPPHRYMQELNLRTGLSEGECMEDQNGKASVLRWMGNNGLDHIEDVGRVMKLYYAEPESIIEAAEKNSTPAKVL